MAGYAAILTAMAFSQSAGRMVADTKFDLLTGPGNFLRGALHMWDPVAAFGQIQNQAYGYLWPMGPFFLLGNLAQVPEWIVQRLWWSVLLCLAFFGVVRLAQRIGIGSPVTQVVAGFAFVLSPRITTLIGGTSIEVWPMALAPWVLLPLVRGSREGSVRRAAALSALVVTCCGGVNAVAVAATLPLGVLWILTRARGPRKWRLLGWWTLFTMLGTLWWSLPLLLLGRYSVPFLDYIENATITTVPTGLARTVVGTSDWVAYFAGIDYTAGQELVTTPMLVLMAAGISAAGLAGVALRGNPERRFLCLSVLVGIGLVGFGYSGELAGFWAADRSALLDGALAPLRNLHKFDVVLRIPLVLGLAHLLTAMPALLQGRSGRWGAGAIRLATVLALVALALPWLHDSIAPRDGVETVPEYWTEVADYLQSTDEGTVSLVVPASAFGVYTWGNTHDDVFQGLAESPWSVRNVIPLAQPGNVVFLDAVTRYLESGHPSPAFARFLAANGVGRLVVRNDLQRFQTGAPDPTYVASLLDQAPGIVRAESFGPTVGAPAQTRAPDGNVRVIEGGGMSSEVGSVDVYNVAGASAATLTSNPKAAAADPSSSLATGVAQLGGGQLLLDADAADAPADLVDDMVGGQVLTDDMRRRETNFAAVRWNESSTMGATTPYVLSGAEHEHRVVDDPRRWQTTQQWTGVVGSVVASTSEAAVTAVPPLRIGDHPGAALDGDPATAWRSARHLDATGQLWQANFRAPTDVSRVKVTLAADSAPVDELEFWGGGFRIRGPAPAPGSSRTYVTRLGASDFLRITAVGRDLLLPGSLAIAEVEVPGLETQQVLNLPVPDKRFPVDLVSLSRDPDRAACAQIDDSFPCVSALAANGEDGDTIARTFVLPTTATYDLSGSVSLRRSVDGARLAATGLRATSTAGPPYDVAAGPTALLDGDPGTTWIASSRNEVVTVEFPRPTRLDSVVARLDENAGAARPTVLRLSSGSKSALVNLDERGRGTLPHWRVSSLDVRVVDSENAFLVVGRQFVAAEPGISSLTFGDEADVAGQEREASTVRSFGCGSGPEITLDKRVVQTEVRASVRDLVRGVAVPFTTCGSSKAVLAADSAHTAVAQPSELFRADTVTLTRGGATPSVTRALAVDRDGRNSPTSIEVPARSSTSLLTLAQNVNRGWVATLDGERLTATRTDGWKQAWLVPAGSAGVVHLEFEPATSYTWAVVAGGVGVLLVVLVLVLGRRRRPVELPALGTGTAGLLDTVVVLGVLALVAGWWGVLAGVVAVVGGRALGARAADGWSVLAGLSFLVASLGLSWDRLVNRSWAVEWTQAWTLVALAMIGAALVSTRVRRRS
jgi:arabinofuranan 3-O-arabinosyltransferase